MTNLCISCEKRNITYFIAYGLILVVLTLNTSFYGQYIDFIWKPVTLVSFILLICNEVLHSSLNKQDVMRLMVTIPCMVVILFYAKGPLENSVALCIALSFCGRKTSFNSVAKFSLVISITILAIIIASAYSGVIPDYVEQGARLRHYMGFRYSLYGSMILANITLLWIYIRKQEFKFIELCLLLFANYWFFVQTNSRLSFFMTVILLIATCLMKHRIQILMRSKLLCSIMICSFILATAVSLFITIKYNSNIAWMSELNGILGGRLSLGKNSIETVGISLLPNADFVLVGNGLDLYGNKSVLQYNYVDCFYIQILQRYGIILFSIFLCTISYAMFRIYKKRDIYLLIIMTFIAMHCMIDDLPIYLCFNTFWLAIGAFIAQGATANNIMNRSTTSEVNTFARERYYETAIN